MEEGKVVSKSFADCSVLDAQGSKTPVSTFWSHQMTLMVLVRHFGCIGCTLQMHAISPRLEELKALGIRTVVVGNGKLQFLDGFIDSFKLKDRPVEVYTDPSLVIYQAAQLKRSIWTVLNPTSLLDYIRAFSKGIGQTSIQGDNFQLGGTLLIDTEGKLLFHHANKSVGNHSDVNDVFDRIYKHVAKTNPEAC